MDLVVFLSSRVPISPHLADEKCPKEAALLVHVHSSGVGHSHKQPIAASKWEQPPLVGGVQRELGAPGPAGGSARLHQQDGNWVGAHLEGDRQVSGDTEVLCCICVIGICSNDITDQQTDCLASFMAFIECHKFVTDVTRTWLEKQRPLNSINTTWLENLQRKNPLTLTMKEKNPL